MRRAIADETETIQSFPAVGLRCCALWVMDEAAASKLGDKYIDYIDLKPVIIGLSSAEIP